MSAHAEKNDSGARVNRVQIEVRGPVGRAQQKPCRRKSRQRQRQLIIAVAVGLASLLCVTWQRMTTVSLRYDLTRAEREVHQLREEQVGLQVALAELVAPDRIEAAALKLGMTHPQANQIIRVRDHIGDPVAAQDEEPHE